MNSNGLPTKSPKNFQGTGLPPPMSGPTGLSLGLKIPQKPLGSGAFAFAAANTGAADKAQKVKLMLGSSKKLNDVLKGKRAAE